LPVLAGMSRKRMIGALTGRDEGERLAGSVAAAVVAAMHGARIIRAHDVRETADALRVVAACGGLRDNRG
jgi:dihydropteroate synthase